MDEPQKALEERLRKVEGHIQMVLGGSVVLAICCVAFVGIEYWRVPRAVHAAMQERIGQSTIERINEAKTLADKLIANAKDNHEWNEKERHGFLIIGDTQICFGTHVATETEPDAPWDRRFAFKFDRPFASPPSITVSTFCESEGQTFAIRFAEDVTNVGYQGELTETAHEYLNETTTNDVRNKLIQQVKRVWVSYVAIGESRK